MRIVKTLIVMLGLLAMPGIAAAPETAAAPRTELAPPPAETAPRGAPVPEAASDVAIAETAEEAAFDFAEPVESVGQPDGRYGLQQQFTELGQRGQRFHDYLLMPIITVISLFVLALLAWVVIRYRRSANPIPSKTSHNTVIEVLWTLIPVLILLVIALPSIGLLSAQYRMPPGESVTVKVTGNQWYWTYEYPDHGGITLISNMLPEEADAADGARFRTDADGPRLLAADERMVIPAGVNIRVIVTASDVLHSFAVPAFWVKMDAVPGRLNETWFRVDRPGVYYGQCSELCGARHAYMPIAVEVVSPARFAQWVAAKGGTMPGAEPAPSADVGATHPGETVNATATAVPVDQAATANQGSNP